MAETPTLFVCHGDEGGPRIHPCRRVLPIHGIRIKARVAIAVACIRLGGSRCRVRICCNSVIPSQPQAR